MTNESLTTVIVEAISNASYMNILELKKNTFYKEIKHYEVQKGINIA